MGSRSIRAGMIWEVLGVFCNDGPETVMDFVDRMGVERLTAGRLRSAGLMSGILAVIAMATAEAARAREKHSATRKVGSWAHETNGRIYAITFPQSD